MLGPSDAANLLLLREVAAYVRRKLSNVLCRPRILCPQATAPRRAG